MNIAVFMIFANFIWAIVNYIIERKLNILNKTADNQFKELENIKESCITSNRYYFYIHFYLYHTRLYDLHQHFWLLSQSLFFLAWIYCMWVV